jgi:hypothetical protein
VEHESGTVMIEGNGKSLEGRFVVQDGIVHVLSVLGVKATQLGDLAPRQVARILLRELADERQWRW